METILYQGFIYVMASIVPIRRTNSYGRNCDIFWFDPFNVGYLVVLVVVYESLGNVLESECKNDNNNNYPENFEREAVCIDDP